MESAVGTRLCGAVEQHLFDADVIVELLDVSSATKRAARRQVQ